MTDREKAIVMAYTGTVMLTGDKLKMYYKYISSLMGEPVYTHEMPALADEIKARAKDDFIELCREEEKNEKTKNITDRNPHDRFHCGECGFMVCDWDAYSFEDETDERFSYDFAMKFCPSCGRKVEK